MEANLYDQPAQAKFLNTYVPINFNELYRIGATQKEAVEQAQSQLGTQLQKWSEFHSPSAKDTQNYYDLTIGKIAPTIQEMSSNPDLIKTAEGRSRLQSLINSVDYSKLGQLKQSREGMIQRQQAIQKLMLEGKYNPLWHDVDFTNYNTLDPSRGIFNDISPLAYKSEIDLVKPFVDNLKASWIGNKGGFEYSGVSTERTDQELMKNLSSIQNTPEYGKHLEMLQRQGYTPEEAEQKLNTTLLNAGREFAYQTRERDPWFMESMRMQAKAAQTAKATGQINNLTTIVQRDAAKKYLENFSGLDGGRVRQLMLGDKPTAQEQQVLSQSLNPQVVQDRLRQEFATVSKNKNNINAGANYVLDKLSSQLSPEASDIYSRQGASEKITSNTYKANDSSNFTLADKLAFSLIGTARSVVMNPEGMANIPANKRAKVAKEIVVRNKFENQWASGSKFSDFIIKGENKQITDGESSYHLKYAYIPIEQFDDYTDEEIKLTGGKVVKMGSDAFVEGLQYDEDGKLIKKTETTKQAEKQYVRIQVTTPIPVDGESATAADNIYSKKTMGLDAKAQVGQVGLSQEERMN